MTRTILSRLLVLSTRVYSCSSCGAVADRPGGCYVAGCSGTLS